MKTPLLLVALAALLSSACQKSIQPVTSTTPRITAVKLISMPWTTAPPLFGHPGQPQTGRPWDATSGPDVDYTLRDSLGTMIHTSAIYNDVAPADLPLAWTIPFGFEIWHPESPCLLIFSDRDKGETAATADDLIGAAAFSPAAWAASGYPATFIVTGARGLQAELTLSR